MISIRHKGNFSHTEKFFNCALNRDYLNVIAKYGELGVAALKRATPIKSGGVASAWTYVIKEEKGLITLSFVNNKENDGMNIVLALVYGHATGNGGYVQANNFVDPAIRPIFKDIAKNLWKEVMG